MISAIMEPREKLLEFLGHGLSLIISRTLLERGVVTLILEQVAKPVQVALEGIAGFVFSVLCGLFQVQGTKSFAR